MYWLWYVLIGLAAGWIGSLIVKGKGYGLLLNLIIGIIGSVLGGWLFGVVGLSSHSMLGSLITAVAGAVILLLILGMLSHKKS